MRIFGTRYSLSPVRIRHLVLLGKAAFAVSAVAFGLRYMTANQPAVWAYWTAVGLLSWMWFVGRGARAVFARWRFDARIRNTLRLTGDDLERLAAIARAIKRRDEDRAFFLLNSFSPSPDQRTHYAAAWLTALAGVRWLSRHRPARPLSGEHIRYPQIHALVFCAVPARVALRPESLARELAEISATELDELARSYIYLVDVLVDSLERDSAPFAAEAENALEFVTGRAYLFNGRARFEKWWLRTRPVLQHGGGALLASLRLLQHEAYGAANALLVRLAEDGLLSKETETIRRAASFLALFARPQWRMTSSDIPRYFEDGLYYLAAEMGVLRFPIAALPEVVNACRQSKVLLESKKRLIEDALDLWDVFPDELAPRLALLLRRLLQHTGRHVPHRASFWRSYWEERRGGFERPTALLMHAIVATAQRDFANATRLFQEAAKLEPQSSLPHVNLVHLHLSQDRSDTARALIDEILARYPKDAPAMISLGRLLAMHLKDTRGAERLFTKAWDCGGAPIEALICLGEVKFIEGLYMESHEYFNHALQLDPALPDPKLGLAHVYLETKRFDLAIENLTAVVRDGPQEARMRANYLLYRTYRETGEDRKAVTHLEQIPSSFFVEPDVLDEIAVHLESEKMYTKAREYAERAMVLRATGQGGDNQSDAVAR